MIRANGKPRGTPPSAERGRAVVRRRERGRTAWHGPRRPCPSHARPYNLRPSVPGDRAPSRSSPALESPMRISSLLIACALLGSSAWAQHESSHYYVQLGLGAVFSADAEDVPGGEVSFDPGYSTSIAFGYENFLDDDLSFSPEIEFYYQNFRVDEEDLQNIPSAVEDDAKAFAIMLN